MCGAPVQEVSLDGFDVGNEAVLQGTVVQGGQPVGGAYVRLLDGTGEFTAEVQTSATGMFRFYAAPGQWTLRVLSGRATADTVVQAVRGKAVQTEVQLPG